MPAHQSVSTVEESPKRKPSAYVQNTYTSQEVYQQPTVDYNEDDSYGQVNFMKVISI